MDKHQWRYFYCTSYVHRPAPLLLPLTLIPDGAEVVGWEVFEVRLMKDMRRICSPSVKYPVPRGPFLRNLHTNTSSFPSFMLELWEYSNKPGNIMSITQYATLTVNEMHSIANSCWISFLVIAEVKGDSILIIIRFFKANTLSNGVLSLASIPASYRPQDRAELTSLNSWSNLRVDRIRAISSGCSQWGTSFLANMAVQAGHQSRQAGICQWL